MSNNAEIIKNFKFYFPSLAKHVVKTEISSERDLKVELDDGGIWLYDDYNKTARHLPPDPDNMTEEQFKEEYGYKLRKILAEKGMMQKELAERTGISYVLISNYINGLKSPTFYRADKIARVLGCPLDDFRFL